MSHLQELQSILERDTGPKDTCLSVPKDALTAVVTELASKKQLELQDLFDSTKNGSFDGMTIEQTRNILGSLSNWLMTRRVQPRFSEAEAILMTQYAEKLDMIRARLS